MPPCSGGGTPSSTRSTCPASPTPTVTALGDLQGVRGRLGYLELLGVDALWLSPIYPSPMVDNGYDVTDHRATSTPVWGDLDAVRRARGRRARARHPGDRRPGAQPHLRPPRLVPRGAGVPARQPGTGAVPLPPGPGRRTGSEPPNDWRSVFGGSAWTREPSTRRTRPGRVVPAPVLPRPARPELDEPGGLGGSGQDAAVLAGPRRRRVPHRRRARHVQAARRRPPPRRTTTRGSTRTTCTTSTG